MKRRPLWPWEQRAVGRMALALWARMSNDAGFRDAMSRAEDDFRAGRAVPFRRYEAAV